MQKLINIMANSLSNNGAKIMDVTIQPVSMIKIFCQYVNSRAVH